MTPSLIPPNISPKMTDFPKKMNVLFLSKDELIQKIDVMGRDAFVAEIAGNPELYRSIPDISRKSKEDKDGVIYTLFNIVNQKVYVGQTNKFRERMRDHLAGRGGALYLQNAINAHGRENFVSVILLAGIEKQEELDLTEIAVIKSLDCLAPGGYNLHVGGKGGPHSDETRKKIGDGNRGKKLSKATRAKISDSNRGKMHTDEARAKMSTSLKGKKRSEATRAAMSARRKGVKMGPLSEKQRAAISALSARRKGMKTGPLSEKHRAAIGAGKRGKTHTSETRKKISDSLKASDAVKAVLDARKSRAVVITIVETGTVFVFDSSVLAAKAMGRSISNIKRHVIKESMGKSGKSSEFKNAYFTARYRDFPTARHRRPPSDDEQVDEIPRGGTR